MSLIRGLIQKIILLALLLAIVYWGASYYLQPSFNVSKNRLDVTQEEIAQVQTNLRLRLAKQALDALSRNSNQLSVTINSSEVDPLVKSWLSSLVLPEGIWLVGSSFSIQEDLGKLELAVQVATFPPVSLSSYFKLSYQENTAIFQIEEILLGRYKLSASTRDWLLNWLARQQAGQENSAFVRIYPQTSQLHLPILLEDDQLALRDMYFSADHLRLELILNIRQLQGELLQRLQGLLPAHLRDIPTLRELQHLLEQFQ